jgi:hypothetical protein
MSSVPQPAAQATQAPPALVDAWPNAKKRVEDGRVTPFVSNYMSAALFGVARGQLAAEWADNIRSPFSKVDNREIAHVAQYYAVTHGNSQLKAKQNYLNFLTNTLLDKASQDARVPQNRVQDLLAGFRQTQTFGRSFSEIARELGFPRFERVEADPFRLLAEMPLPIYITTSHHQFLEYALARTQEKKEPVSEIFYWGDHLEEIPSVFDKNPDWEPSVHQPLVYHLYGLDCEPESMALSEDDFLDLLDRLAELRYQAKLAEMPMEGTSRRRHDLPAVVRYALSSNNLLTLGYSVATWEFRVLLRGLILPYSAGRLTGRAPEGICMQFKPGELDAMEGNPRGIRTYLEQYFKNVKFRVYWGSVESCVHQLYDLWQLQAVR